VNQCLRPGKRIGWLTAAAFAVALLPAGFSLPIYGEAQAASPAGCRTDAIEQSICIYQTILADVRENYPQRGGGGIASIKQDSTTTFTVSLPQEERIDLLHYEIILDKNGRVSITGRRQGTQSVK
jgi:hypothetical protein